VTRRATVAASMAVATLAAIALGGCGGGSSRGDVMAAVADEVAIPAFVAAQSRAGQLDVAIETACTEPSAASLGPVTDAVEPARSAWFEAEATWIGPAMARRSPGVVDWPIDEDEIVELLETAEPGQLDAAYLGRSIGADNRGFGAIEWVASDPAELGGVDPAVRCEYLTGLSDVIVSEIDSVLADWTESFDGDAPYRAVFAGDGGDPVDEQVDMIVNDTLGTLETMRDEPEAPTAAVQAARLRGLRRLYAGDGGDVRGLSPLLGDELASTLTAELDAAIDAYQQGDVAAGVAATDDVQRTVATEVVSRLGVTVGFSDNDGDGGA
jgi:predicted lipoprotein